MKKKNISNISIIGLGKLGSPMVAVYASRGYKIIGVDVNPDFVKAINKGKAPVFEPNLGEYLKKYKNRILATQDYKKAVLDSDITFIIVPTPSKSNRIFSTKHVVNSGKEIGKALKEKKKFHFVVLTSTVAPGSTEKDLLPVLEKYSGKKCGVDFGLCYNPEFIALGSVIHDILNPDFVLIGESDKKSGDILENFYKNICKNNPPIKRMNIINAEITKIALNTYVTTKISYANMLAELCEKIPGGNFDVVTNALGCDTRIGHKYLKGALGYSGPCFPRDNKALISTAKRFGTPLLIAEATDKINNHQVNRMTEKVLSLVNKKKTVSILGLSYKPNTDVIEESQGIKIISKLLKKRIKVMVYDPAAMANAKKIFGKKIIFAPSLFECAKRGDIIVITTPWSEFKSIKLDWLKGKSKKKTIVDCWRILDYEKYGNAIKYIPLGVNII